MPNVEIVVDGDSLLEGPFELPDDEDFHTVLLTFRPDARMLLEVDGMAIDLGQPPVLEEG